MGLVKRTPVRTALPYVSTSSGIKSSSGIVIARKSILVGLVILTNGTNDVTAIVYDNASAASGTVLAKLVVVGADKSGGIMHLLANAENGLYLSISGTGAEVIAYYI